MPHSVQVVVMFREEESRVNVTFRSKGLLDVALVAKHFGGGGHKQASGCKIQASLQEAQEAVTAYVLEKIAASKKLTNA